MAVGLRGLPWNLLEIDEQCIFLTCRSICIHRQQEIKPSLLSTIQTIPCWDYLGRRTPATVRCHNNQAPIISEASLQLSRQRVEKNNIHTTTIDHRPIDRYCDCNNHEDYDCSNTVKTSPSIYINNQTPICPLKRRICSSRGLNFPRRSGKTIFLIWKDMSTQFYNSFLYVRAFVIPDQIRGFSDSLFEWNEQEFATRNTVSLHDIGLEWRSMAPKINALCIAGSNDPSTTELG
eukprot:scaffold1845_cov174-Amphora_coffeaeformis.AAC.1